MKVIHWKLCNCVKFILRGKSYIHKAENLEKKTPKIICDFEVKFLPEEKKIVIITEKKRICQPIFIVTVDHRDKKKKKKSEKILEKPLLFQRVKRDFDLEGDLHNNHCGSI